MKLSNKSIIISSIIVVSIAILIATAAIIKINLSKPLNLLKTLPDVDLKIKGFSYTEVDESNDKLEAKADIATYDKKKKTLLYLIGFK